MSVLTRKTIVGVAAEVTEGIYVAPAAGDVLCVVGFPTVSPTIEKLERNLVKGTIGQKKPLSGLRAGTLELVTELRAGGVTGGESDLPEADLLLRCALGRHNAGTSSTTDVGSTATDIVLVAGGGAGFQPFGLVWIDGEVRFVVAIAGDTLTLNSALAHGAPGAGEAVKRGQTYKPASEGHPPLSVTVFQDAQSPGSGPVARGIGARVSNLALTDFTVGQIPKLTVGLELLDHDEVIATAPASPVFGTQTPPVVIHGIAQKDGVQFDIGALELTLENTIAREVDINQEGGTRRLFVGGRSVTGTVDPFMAQGDVALQDAWRDNETFSLFVALGIKDASGDIVQGSAVGIYIPNAVFTENAREDADGVLKHTLSFQAHESDLTSGDDELFLGFV